MTIFVNDPDFSLDPLYEKGYTTFDLEPNFARLLYKQLKKEDYILDKPETDLNQSYEDRFYVKKSESLKPKYNLFVQQILAPFLNALKIYQWDGEYDLNFLKSGPNYWMEWHSDILDESYFSILIYFTDEEITDKHGGQLVISKLKRDGDANIVDRKITGEVLPRFGKVVILENQMPCFQHKANKIEIPYSRYLLDITLRRPIDLNINNNPYKS